MDDFYAKEFNRPLYPPQPMMPPPPGPGMGPGMPPGYQGGCNCNCGDSTGSSTGQGQDPVSPAAPEEEDGYTKAEKLLVVMKHMVNTSDAIVSELPTCLPRITSGKERGNETLSLTVTIK